MCRYANDAIRQSAEGGKFFFGMRNFDELPLLEPH